MTVTASSREDAQPATPPHQRGISTKPGGQVELIELKDIFQTLWRRRRVIVGTVFAVTALALLVVQQLTPIYTASTFLTLQTRKEAVVDIQAVMSGLNTDASVIRTELDVIKSRRLLTKVVNKLNLTQDPEFNPSLRPPSPFSLLLNPRNYLSPEWLGALGFKVDDLDVMSEDERVTRAFAATIDALQGGLTVTNPPLSYTIEIDTKSEDPKKAARIANTLAELYLTDQLEAKFEATQRATDWLSERIKDLKTRVLQSERAVQEYREKNKIVQAGSQGTVSDQQLAEINTLLINARTDLAGVQARYDQVKELIGHPEKAETLSDVLRSPIIQTLGVQETEIRRKQAELSKRYGPRHPETIALDSQLSNIHQKISEEISKVLRSVDNELQVARSRVTALTGSLETLKAESTKTEKARVQLRELEREAETSRVLLETFLSRFKETSNQDDLQQADARIISNAEIPTSPSAPKKKLLLGVALALSLILGLILVIILEALDHGYRTLAQIERLGHIKGLGSAPKLTSQILKGAQPYAFALDHLTSAYSESIRSIHTALIFGSIGATRPRTVMVTSTAPREGKTTFSLSLAMLLSKSGNSRVLYVEADLRKPRAQLVGPHVAEQETTLSDYLTGATDSWQSAIVTDPASGLAIIHAGAGAPNAQALLQSDRMKHLLTDAASHYDFILIDSPPVLPVSDPVVLSQYVDAVLFLIQWESTPREAAHDALDQLRHAGAPIAGAVLTQVDIKKATGYGIYGRYYGRYKSYYAD